MQSYYDRNRRFEITSTRPILTRSKTANIKSLSSYVGNYSTQSLRITGFEKRSSESPVKFSKTIENSLDIKDTRENLAEQEFYNRLISAHHRVDELLKSRGIKSEEKEPSFDNDYSFTFPRHDNFNSSSWSTRRSSRKHNDLLDTTKNCYAKIILDKASQDLSASLLFPPSMNEERVDFSISDSIIEIEPDNESKDEVVHITKPITPVTRVNLSITLPKCAVIESNFTQALMKSAKWLQSCSAASINVAADSDSNSAGCSSSNKEAMVIKKSFFLNRARQLRTVFRQAEVSIQHCSFYKVSKRFENHENCVRLNLRLTERTPLNMNTSIVIIANARPISIREYFVEPPRRTSPEKLNSSRLKTDPTSLNYPGQAHKDNQTEKRKISRLRIPEQFLNITSENNNCPQLIGGFIYDCEIPKKPASRFKLPTSTNKRILERRKQISSLKFDADDKKIELSSKISSLSPEIELRAIPKMLITIDQSSRKDHGREHPILRKTSQNSRQISKDSKMFDIPIRLKKVDHSIVRPRIVFESNNKWIPSWRKQRSCE